MIQLTLVYGTPAARDNRRVLIPRPIWGIFLKGKLGAVMVVGAVIFWALTALCIIFGFLLAQDSEPPGGAAITFGLAIAMATIAAIFSVGVGISGAIARKNAPVLTLSAEEIAKKRELVRRQRIIWISILIGLVLVFAIITAVGSLSV